MVQNHQRLLRQERNFWKCVNYVTKRDIVDDGGIDTVCQLAVVPRLAVATISEVTPCQTR